MGAAVFRGRANSHINISEVGIPSKTPECPVSEPQEPLQTFNTPEVQPTDSVPTTEITPTGDEEIVRAGALCLIYIQTVMTVSLIVWFGRTAPLALPWVPSGLARNRTELSH
jgi:hypothetical protein